MSLVEISTFLFCIKIDTNSGKSYKQDKDLDMDLEERNRQNV